MPLTIPAQHGNLTVTFNNGSAGASAKSTISMGFATAVTLDQTMMDRLANISRDAFTPLFDNSWILGPCRIVWNHVGAMEVLEDTGTEAGTASSTAYASPAVAHVISKSTGRVGKRYRGRCYLPGVPESSVDESGTLDGTRVNAVTTACRGWLVSLKADAAIEDTVLFHDSDSGGDQVPTSLTDFFCRTIVGTMRPRQRR